MRPNLLRQRLNSGKPTLGTRTQAIWPSIAEIIGQTGMYDYVEFLAEYAPYTLPDLDNFCRAAELHNLGTVIKVDQANSQFVAQRAIGSGFQGVIFADCRTPEDVCQFIRSVRPDTPEDGGLHGAAMRRFAYMGYGGNAEYVQSLRDIVIVMMIEKQSAVEQLEAILSIPGIDMVQWGPADYAMSIGKPGQRKSPESLAAERKVIDTCLRMGIPPRIEISSPDEAARYLDLGVRHFSLGIDLNILYHWWTQNGETLRKLME